MALFFLAFQFPFDRTDFTALIKVFSDMSLNVSIPSRLYIEEYTPKGSAHFQYEFRKEIVLSSFHAKGAPTNIIISILI